MIYEFGDEMDIAGDEGNTLVMCTCVYLTMFYGSVFVKQAVKGRKKACGHLNCPNRAQ